MVVELDKSLDIARIVIDSKKFSRMSNCKMMATRMLQFQLETISPKVQHSMKRMHEFFVTTYSGVGCLLCNADSHKFFDGPKKTVTVSDHFCREMTSSSLHVLLYLHVHYLRFYRLASNFMSKCDHAGNYNEEAAVPAEASIKIDEGKEKDLLACKEFRNDGNWLTSCSAICEDFNLVKLEETFYPHIDGYVAATKFLTDRHNVIMEGKKAAEAANPPPAAEGDDKKKEGEGEGEKKEGEAEKKEGEAEKKEEKKSEGKEERILERTKFLRDSRILEEDKKTEETKKPDETKKADEAKGDTKETPEIKEVKEPETAEDKLKDAKDPIVYVNAPKAGKDLEAIKPKFAEQGINPFEVGKMVKLEETVYNAIKTEIAAAIEAAKTEGGENGGKVVKKTSGLFFAGINRSLIGALFTVFGLLIMKF